MPQEVSLTLKADTREAVKSVKELEQQVSNLDKLEKKGGADNGFLSQNDVKQFRRMSQETERIYREFFDKLSRVQRDIEKKKKQLEEAQKRGAGSSSTDALNREIKELEAKRNIIQSQTGQVTKMYNQGQQHQQNIQGYRSQSDMSTMLLGSGKQLFTAMGFMIGAGFLAKTLQQGASQVKADERYMSGLGQRTQSYLGDYDQGRKDAEAVGKMNGNAYTAMETMQVADAYTSQAGFKSKEDMWTRTSEIQTASRVMGVDANELASTYGSLGKQGALEDATDFKKFKESMIGAIKETGMAGRDSEFIKAVDGLATQVGSGQLSLSSAELQNIVGLQTALGSGGEAGLQGEKGASIISSLDSGVKSGNASIDTMLGWGSDYQGITGRYELEMLKAQGIGSEEVQAKLFKNLTSMAGGNTENGKAYQALFLKDNFGISIEEASALVEKAHAGDLLKGKDKLENSGASEDATNRLDYWNNSKVQTDVENDVDWQNTQKAGGQYLRDVWEGGKDLFHSQPEALKWAEMGAVGIGGTYAAGKVGGAIARKFGASKVGDGTKKPGIASKAKDALKSSDDFLKAGSTLAKGVKAIPVIGAGVGGVIETLDAKSEGEGWGKALSKGAGSIIGGVAGAAVGAIGGGGVASVATGTAGAMAGSAGGSLLGEKIYDFFTGKGGGKTADDEAQKRIADKETENLDIRKSIINAEENVLDKERKNLDEMKTLMGSESGSVSGDSGSGGGFFSGIWSGLKSFFGFGNTASASGGVASTTYAAGKSDFSGNTNAEKTWSFLKSKGFSDAAAAGIMGNLQQESGLDPTKKQSGGGPGRGIMQWEEGGRWDSLTSWATQEGRDPLSLETQLEYMWKEMNGADSTGKSILDKKYGGLEGLKSATDTTWAVEAFEKSFERAGKPNYTNRNNYAESILQTYGGSTTTAKSVAGMPQSSLSLSSSSAWETMSNVNNLLSAASAQTLNVTVSGAIDGLTKENNSLVADAIINNIKGSNISLAYQQRQGIGGNL